MSVTRRSLLTTSGAALLPLAAPRVGRAAETRTLRFVPASNLSVLDPVWTTAAVTIMHGYCVFDTLYGVDGKLQPQPQMAAGATVSDDGRTWLITLRDGLKFHDGTPVRAIDCAASLQRWSKRDTFGQTLGNAVDSFEAADDRTLRIRMKRPFPRLLEAIGKPHSSPAFIMPERLARTDPLQQVTEMVGSGPFRFVPSEYVSGATTVYERFADYVSRDGNPDWTSGGKRVGVDRLEWTVMPDSATAAAALQRGEIDWWEHALPDLIPLLEKTPEIRLQVQDPYGLIAVARFNATQSPFDNAKLRAAVLSAIDQSEYMATISGADPSTTRTCYAMFPCGMPGVKELGTAVLKPPHDLAKVREAVKAAGYKGEKVVIVNPTDIPVIGPHGQVTAELLKSIGFDVDLQEMDWGSVMQRRLSTKRSDDGGWSIYHTNWPSVSIANPALNTTIRGDGKWSGGYTDAITEDLTEQWLSAKEPATQQTALDQIQMRALEQAPTIPLGQFFVKTAFRKNLQGVMSGSVCYFWNVQKA